MAVNCPICGWTFRSEEAVRKHAASHHQEDEFVSRSAAGSTHQDQEHQAPPGWYRNPRGEGERYWDGTQWSPWSQGTDQPSVGKVRLFLSYLAAVLFPIGGLVAGILLLVRRSTAHGIAVLVISIGIGAAGLLVIQDSSNSGGARSVHDVVDQNSERAQKCFRGAANLSPRQITRCVNRAVRLR